MTLKFSARFLTSVSALLCLGSTIPEARAEFTHSAPLISNQTSDSGLDFSFFGKHIHLDCSEATPGTWKAKYYPDGLIKSYWRLGAQSKYCHSGDFHHEGQFGGVKYSLTGPSEVTWDEIGNVASILSLEVDGSHDRFYVTLDPSLGEIQMERWSPERATFFENGALKSVDSGSFSGGHLVPFEYIPAGQSNSVLVKQIRFTRDGTIDAVIPCDFVDSEHNTCR